MFTSVIYVAKQKKVENHAYYTQFVVLAMSSDHQRAQIGRYRNETTHRN